MADIESRLELNADTLDFTFNAKEYDFPTTDSLEPLDGIVGQPRAMRALELGLGINDPGYNIYVAGMSGMGKKAMISRFLRERAINEPTPSDWIYVQDFDNEDRPLAIELQAGQGVKLRDQMNRFVNSLREDLPKAFREEDFGREKIRINQSYEQRGREIFDKLEKLAEEKNLVVQQTPDGHFLMIPKVDGRTMTSEEFDQLNDIQKDEISHRQQELGEQLGTVLTQQRNLATQLRNDVREVEKNFGLKLIEPHINEIASQYTNEKLQKWFTKVKEHMVDNLQRFQEKEPHQANALPFFAPPEDTFIEYQVNVIIDNSNTKGAPIVVEESPNYKNMFGTIYGSIDRSGRLQTQFTNINAGSILKANGGYLVFNMLEAMMEPLVWKELKRTIKSGYLEYHMYDPFGVFVTSALRPEPIPLKVKIVVVGNPLVYHILQLYDEDFPELFKVKADFASEIERTDATDETLGRFVRKLKGESGVLAFDRGAMTELIRASVRMAGDKKKITAEFSKIADLVRESSYWARQENSTVVSTHHIRKAVDEKIYRSNLVEERIQELIDDGTLILQLDGTAVGQINGLGVIDLGDYMFGKPSRLTASVGVGTAGIINIERESRMSGKTFDKAMLIIEGYLRNKYASKHPLALSASLAMEQSYGMIEGDSATIAEILCLLSAFSNIPLRQDIAITGSVNQWGQIQAVGGVSEKTEGFYHVCKSKGLTGNQGVCIPAANVKNMILHPEVIEAVRDRRFHIYATHTVDEAIELMSGISAGSIGEPASFHWRVDSRLQEMLSMAKEQRTMSLERDITQYNAQNDTNRDPRPRFPGQEEPFGNDK